MTDAPLHTSDGASVDAVGLADELDQGAVAAEGSAPDGATVDEAVPPTSRWAEHLVTGSVVTACCLFVFWQLQPDLLLSNTTPTGGDMGAHVWGPAFLRDELLPRFRLTGWTPDWYSGFPAFHFYMVIPALAIVLLDIGLHPVGAIVALASLVFGVWKLWTDPNLGSLTRHRRWLTVLAGLLALVLVPFPYNVAFKLVSVSGVVLFPVGAWALGHFGGLRFPGPAFLSLASLAFAFDRSFNIYGGNIASTLAGEFAASISLTLSLVALGLIIRGTRTGEYRAAAAAFIALTGLTHLLPAFFLLAATAVVMVIRMCEQRWRSIGWLATAGVLSAFVSSFWVLPFFVRTDYLNDMGWERIELLHSPLVTRSNLNPANVLSDYPPLTVLLILGVVGLVGSIIARVELGWILAGTAAIMAAGFVWFPDGRLWNARILPFYYLCVGLLAGLGVALAVRAIARLDVVSRVAVAFVSVGMLLVPGIRRSWDWPEPGEGVSFLDYATDAGGYTIRVLATVGILLVVLTEIPRQLHRFARQWLVVAAMVGVGIIVASPARDLRLSDVFTRAGFPWAVFYFLSIASIVALAFSIVRTLRGLDAEPVAEPARTEPVSVDGVVEFSVAPPEPPSIAERLGTVRDRESVVLRTAPLMTAVVLFVLLGLALDVVGGAARTDGENRWTLGPLEVASADTAFIPGWARWNYSGLEAKPRNDGAIGDVGKGGWAEYEYVQRTMLGVGEQNGCGRAFWEFAPELNRYGTTMAMMLLPMWTDGCIGSMEGLYFEATPSVPYHFLLQSDLSAPSREVGASSQRVGGPSQAMRDLPYGTFDIDRGVDRLYELGVRYYLAFNPQSIEAARNHPDLTEVTGASPWVVFETDAQLVEPLTSLPVVIDDVRNHQDQWLDVGVEWFQAPTSVRPASSGPEGWPRVEAESIVQRYEAEGTLRAGSVLADAPSMPELLPVVPVEEPVTVFDVETDTDRISFRVDQVGQPILVRTSYFPSWTADGADGPYRVAPNFMVVVPTENSVELTFSRQGIDWLSLVLTAIGAVGIIGLGLSRRREPS